MFRLHFAHITNTIDLYYIQTFHTLYIIYTHPFVFLFRDSLSAHQHNTLFAFINRPIIRMSILSLSLEAHLQSEAPSRLGVLYISETHRYQRRRRWIVGPRDTCTRAGVPCRSQSERAVPRSETSFCRKRERESRRLSRRCV